MEFTWLFAVAGGALILGLALAYGVWKDRRLTPQEEAASAAKTRQIYKEEEEPTSNPLETVQDLMHQPKPGTRPTTDAGTGTTDDRPRWEGPEESRPRGYRRANDDPSRTPDAAGETLKEPGRTEKG